MPKNWCFWTVVLEKTLEHPLNCKEIKAVHPKGNQSWILEGLMLKPILQYLVTWCEELTHLKRPWCWEILKVGEEGDDRWWDGWMASLTQWTWVWVNSGSWWWTREAWHDAVHGVTKSQTWLSDWTELNWKDPKQDNILKVLFHLAFSICFTKHSTVFFLNNY